MFFLIFLLDDRRIRIRISEYCIRIRIRIWTARKHMDPTDPDPQHWFVSKQVWRTLNETLLVLKL
jgi:hypothetical protein